MSWNLWWRFGDDWQARQPAILSTLRAVDADVIALQETWPRQVTELALALRFHGRYAGPSYPPAADIARANDSTDLGIGLLSRWPITTWTPVVLPSRHRPGFHPVALLATMEHPVAPLYVVGACLEYDPAYNDDRLAQAGLLAALATDPALDGPLPVIVAGDLNAPPDSPLLRPLAEVLQDAWNGAADESTSPPDAGSELRGRRIDHILYRPGQYDEPVTVRSSTLAGEPVDGVEPSDHRAIVCELFTERL